MTFSHRWATAAAAVVLSFGTVACSTVAAAPPVTAAPQAAPGSSAATPTPTVDATTVNRIVAMRTADGGRTAIVHHPADLADGAPLVVVLHPAATSAATMQANFGWDALADREGFVVAYPDGLLDLYQDTWNGGRCCPPASQLGTDDVGFLDLLVAALRTYDRVGPQVYAVGFSNGAIMAYAWACQRPGALSGIGVVAGAVMTDCVDPAPLNVVAVHGTADPSIPVDGGPGPDDSRFPPLDDSLAPFRSAAQCAAEPQTSDDGVTAVSTWQCGDHRVVRDLVAGLDHAWPGAGQAAAGTSDGPLDATGFLWANLR